MSSSQFYSFSDEEDEAGSRPSPTLSQSEAGPSRLTASGARRTSQAPTEDSSESLGVGFGLDDPSSMHITPPRRSTHREESTPTRSEIRSLPAITRLQKIWVAERTCPDLLSWSGHQRGSNTSSTSYRCDEVVDEVCAQIEQQMSILNLLSADENTSEEEHLRLSLVQLDVERAKWLLRAYLRTRISKLEAHSAHYALLPQSHLSILLSPLEKAYLTKYDSLRTSHLTSSVLTYLPESLQSLTDLASPLDYNGESDSNSKGNIIEKPDIQNSPVFIQCLEDCGNIRMEDGDDATLSEGSIHLISFGKIRHLVSQGRVELI
ncbi:unnamed protein product [Sympodiomycopsis kandeliae]